MKDEKGQALIEFVILLPIIIMIIFIIIDFGTIFFQKNKLENISADIVEIYNSTNNIDKNKFNDIDIKLTKNGEYLEINISKDLNLLTPVLNKTELKTISTKRIIYER